MGLAHFIITSVEGQMIALCGVVIPPKQTTGAQVGIYGQTCPECNSKVKAAWVTVK